MGSQGSNDFGIFFQAQFVVRGPVKYVPVFGGEPFPIVFKSSLYLSRRGTGSEDEVFWKNVLHGLSRASKNRKSMRVRIRLYFTPSGLLIWRSVFNTGLHPVLIYAALAGLG